MFNCAICGNLFFPMSAMGKYCSKVCASRANNAKRVEAKQRWYLNSVGRTEKLIRTSEGRWQHKNGYILVEACGKLVYEHRLLAERALGRPLPEKAIVHHTGERWDNHGFCKLVLCPNQAYHVLLHTRAENASR